MPACRFLVAALLAACVPAGRAEEGLIDHRFAPRRGAALLATFPMGHRAVVGADGGLRYADGSFLRVAVADGPKGPGTQRLLGGRLPIVITSREGKALSLELTAFAATDPPMDCLRLTVRNRTDQARRALLRFEAGQADGTLGGGRVGFRRGGEVVALIELREGAGRPVAAEQPKRHVFRRQGGRALPRWAKPKGPCDAGFRDIVAGFEQPATYHLKVEPDGRYVVAVGLCESHWREPGHRICDLLVEGQKVATVDPVEAHGPDQPFVLAFPAQDRDGDGWLAVTSVANPKSPDQNSIINVVWLFEEDVGKTLAAEDILAGRATARAACYVDCGGEAQAPGPATLRYRLDLPPRGAATLWARLPAQRPKVAEADELAGLDPANLLEAAEKQWRQALARLASVELAQGAPADLAVASVVNLLALCSPEGQGVLLRPGPFASRFSPRAAAFAAVALDQVGAPQVAARILDGLAARQGGDRLWHGADGPWCASGQALWALVGHYRLTGDRAWLEAHYPAIRRGAEALVEARELTKWVAHDPQSPFHGLVPAASYRGLPSDQWFVQAFWAWHGIRCAAEAARAVERPGDALWLEDRLRGFRASLRHALARSRVLGPAAGCLPAVPGEAERWTFATAVTAVWPAPVLADEGSQLDATLAYLERHAVEHLPGGLDGRSPVVEVPLACRYALARLARGEREQAVAAFASIANAASAAGAFPQGIELGARKARGPMPSAEAAAGYVLLLREMLVSERGEELHLCSCVPRAWLSEGLSVQGAPTRFGRVSFRARLADGGAKLVVEPEFHWRRPPEAVVVHAPVPGRGAQSADPKAKRIEVDAK